MHNIDSVLKKVDSHVIELILYNYFYAFHYIAIIIYSLKYDEIMSVELLESRVDILFIESDSIMT